MGRHRVDDPAVVVIRVRVTRAEQVDLARVARDNRTTVSGVIRDSVDEYVADYSENQSVFNARRQANRRARVKDES